MPSPEFARRLRIARINAGFKSAREAAEKLGLRPQTVLAHENPGIGGREPKIEYLEKYKRFYGVTYEWLTGMRPMEDIVQDQNDVIEAVIEPVRREPVEPAPIPVPATQPTSNIELMGVAQAGHWLEIDQLAQDRGEIVNIPLNHGSFAVTVAGDSMNRILMDGDVAICKDIPARDGDIVLVKRTRAGLHEVTIKRLRNNKLMPESTDPKWQTPLDLNDGEVEIIAVVTGSYRKFGG